jgi:hypothetical protein
MRVADRRQFKLTNKRRTTLKWLSIGLVCVGACAGVFVLANAGMLFLYRGKVLPNYSVAAVPIGGVNFDQLDKKVSVETLLPAKLEFKKDDKVKEIAPKDLGVSVDWDATREHIQKSHNWLPLTSLLFRHSVPVELKLDNATFASAVQDLNTAFSKVALPERIAFRNDNFAIVAPEPGYQLDAVALRLDIITVLEQGKAGLAVPTTVTNATEPTGKLGGELSLLQKRLEAKITLQNGTNKKQLSRAEIADFYEPSGQTLVLSTAKMAAVVSSVAAGFGITAVNQQEAVQASWYALTKQQAINFVLAKQGIKVYHYCTAVKGVDASALTEFRQKLAYVYAEPRGWNNGGSVALAYAESGCDFTVWLSAPAYMTGFGAICDNYYSCRVGPNVVINYDRWMGATDPWNAAGGTLEEYRVMVINHETGHWFGFAHRTCPGAGQPAPVMQQQSISLNGCTFNAWPTSAELGSL